MGGLRITVVANPQGTITPLALRNQLSCQWNVAGPSTWSVPAVSLALLPMTKCRSLHWRVSRSFWRGRLGCAAAPAVAMPELDLEMTAMLSRAAERIGLEWRKPPCPEPSRLDDWFLRVAWPSSSRLHRSRLRRSNMSCLGGQLLPPPVRRLQRPACSSPRVAPCVHPRSRTASAAAFKSGAVELGVGRERGSCFGKG